MYSCIDIVFCIFYTYIIQIVTVPTHNYLNSKKIFRQSQTNLYFVRKMYFGDSGKHKDQTRLLLSSIIHQKGGVGNYNRGGTDIYTGTITVQSVTDVCIELKQ